MASIMAGVDARTQLVGRNRLELLLFYLGDKQCFGINVFKVREVIECPPITRSVGSHPLVRGVSNIRGKVISMLDLAAAIGNEPLDLDKKTYVIVSEYNKSVQGFLVSGIERIVNMNWEEIKPPPSGIGRDNFLTAVTRVNDEIIGILDIEKVLVNIMGFSDEINEDTMDIAEENYDNKHVLVVDDSSMARKQITQVLDKVGISYTVAKTGKEAYEILTGWLKDDIPIRQRCSLVVSDVEMPEMDGYTLTKKIKEHEELQQLTVLLHSSLSGVFNEKMVEKVGADEFLPKFNSDDLAKRVLAHMRPEQ
jgi:two-component system, chemotaxis family, chemotaxis protein CheV